MESPASPGGVCEICHNEIENKVHSAREMMLGFRDSFRYLECNACGCLQLLDPPTDIGRYYPSDYTAFRDAETQNLVAQRLRNFLRKRRNRGVFDDSGWLGRFLARHYRHLQLQAFARLGVGKNVRILDVGCGSGTVLRDLEELGYKNLFGVDRFIPHLTDNHSGVRITKGGLEDLSSASWDVIMFHHSFEHMPDPARVLNLAASMLTVGGHCLIRIPVIGWAWHHYGVNWGQLDAPRHLFLHSVKSFRMLADVAGLRVHAVNYDSNEFQFWVSELYARDISLSSLEAFRPVGFSRAQLRRFRLEAARLNSEARGDSAVFDLVKP